MRPPGVGWWHGYRAARRFRLRLVHRRAFARIPRRSYRRSDPCEPRPESTLAPAHRPEVPAALCVSGVGAGVPAVHGRMGPEVGGADPGAAGTPAGSVLGLGERHGRSSLEHDPPSEVAAARFWSERDHEVGPRWSTGSRRTWPRLPSGRAGAPAWRRADRRLLPCSGWHGPAPSRPPRSGFLSSPRPSRGSWSGNRGR